MQLPRFALSLEWWRERLFRESQGSSFPGLTPEARSVFARAETALEQAVGELRAVLGSGFVERTLRQYGRAARGGGTRMPTGFLLRIARAEQTRKAFSVRTTPSFLQDATWVVLVSNAVSRVASAKGAELAFARLADGDAGDDAAFEIVAAAWLADELGGAHRVQFQPPAHAKRTADLLVLLGDAEWAPVECKRQRDMSKAAARRNRACEALDPRLRKVARQSSSPITIHVSSREVPDALVQDWLVQAARNCVVELERTSGQTIAMRTLEDKGTSAVVRIRDPSNQSLEFNAEDAVPGAVQFRGSMPVGLNDRDGTSPQPCLVYSFGPDPTVQEAKSAIDRASGQLPEAGGGVVALWSRASEEAAWAAVVEGARASLRPGINSRLSGVYLFGMDIVAPLNSGGDLRRALRVAWVPHPTAKLIVRWPTGGGGAWDVEGAGREGV